MNQIYNKSSQQYCINTTTGAPSIASMHYHNTYDIYYMESGRREYFVEDKIFTASTGNFVLIKAYSFHQIGKGNLLRTFVSFTDDFLENTFSPAAVAKLVKCFDTPLICPTEEEQTEYKNLLKVLAKCKDSTTFALNLGMLLLKFSNTSSEQLHEDRISNIVRYINEHFSEIYSLNQIADHMHISKQHLCRLFKQSMNMTLIDYLNKIKIKNACAFLETTDISMTEICLKCGFGSSAYFSTIFKNNTGMTPLKYRQANRNQN